MAPTSLDNDRQSATELAPWPRSIVQRRPDHGTHPSIGSDPMVPGAFEVVSARRETTDTFTLVLAPASDEVPSFLPGQFNMVYAFGIGEVPISISGDPSQVDQVVHTTRRVGAVTRAICATRRGAVLGLRGPFGSAWPMNEAHGGDLVIIAGGIGLAPLRPAIYQVLKSRDLFRRVSILYGARTDHDLLFRRELEAWRSRLDLELAVTVDRGGRDWNGNVGVVTTLLGRATFEPQETIAMICGPEVMMRFTIMELRRRGVPEERIFLSMERNMKCGIGLCGHCQFGPDFVCMDGPVFRYSRIRQRFDTREV